ncbi:MAG: DNA recombination protein RmuC [Alphaproteobacteria bacterium GM7ARS4]|nr:DNA recombination protein RmuC [Alphaproteobacteria bacterium GM7ARS4]
MDITLILLIVVVIALAFLGYQLAMIKANLQLLGQRDPHVAFMESVMQFMKASFSDLFEAVYKLRQFMDNSQTRGAFGEVTLEEMVRDQLSSHYYAFQYTLSNGMRVDCLLKFDPPLGPLAIDSKFPLSGYRAIMEAQDKTQKAQAKKEFERAVRKGIDDIAKKYIIRGETSDMALMFIPNECVFNFIHKEFGDVVGYARRKNVFMVSPETLWVILNTMRAVLRDAKMREQLPFILKKLIELVDNDVDRLAEHVKNLLKYFNLAVKELRSIEAIIDEILKKRDDISSLDPDK